MYNIPKTVLGGKEVKNQEGYRPTVITKKRDFHHVKRRTWLETLLLFFRYHLCEKSFSSLKNTNNRGFLNSRNFFI